MTSMFLLNICMSSEFMQSERAADLSAAGRLHLHSITPHGVVQVLQQTDTLARGFGGEISLRAGSIAAAGACWRVG